jgi:type I restriction enzyme M protein
VTDIVGKLWGFCHTLRHDGIDYGDYIEQLTYLLFSKMIEEKGAEISAEYSWAVLREKSGTDLLNHYMDTLRGLGQQKDMLGDIYGGAISRFSNPVSEIAAFGIVLDQKSRDEHVLPLLDGLRQFRERAEL